MSFEIGATMIALVIGAFLIGMIVGRWPSWTWRRRIWMSGVCSVALACVGFWWAAGIFAVISAENLTYNRLLSGSGRYIDPTQHLKNTWTKPVDGWNRPFLQGLSVEREITTDSEGAGAMREFIAFEVRSLGANGIRDEDDFWVQFEVVPKEGQLRLIGRRWGNMNERPEDWTFPREERLDARD